VRLKTQFLNGLLSAPRDATLVRQAAALALD